MKQYIKGIITGLIIAATIAAVPTLAANIDALLNPVRININGVDTYQWGEEIVLDNGTTTPSSILYNGTTYLPMRKLGELMDKQIYYNGDTQTVSMTGKQTDIKVVTEKPDANGNVWTYYTFKDEKSRYYLGVKDEARGFERVYLMPSESVRVTDNEIYFARIKGYAGRDYVPGMPQAGQQHLTDISIVKLNFENMADTQDGKTIARICEQISGELLFDGDYIYYVAYMRKTWRDSDSPVFRAHNYITNEITREEPGSGATVFLNDLKITESTADKAVMEYVITPGSGTYTVTYDKIAKKFIYKYE